MILKVIEKCIIFIFILLNCYYIKYVTNNWGYFYNEKLFYNEFEDLNCCTEYHKNNIDEHEHAELKVLYDLYDDFYNFKTESLGNRKTICDHGTKCVTIYKHHVDKCQQNYENGLCINLIIFKNQYDEHIENINWCHEKIQHLDSIESDMKAIILLPFVVMIVISIILLLLYKVCNNTIINNF
ncbi:hypothetical protein PVNG_04455 [Plasmodium vivax North Korean]|uniref:Uncharacterized protein n=1 Tax=Plasmodium vivax North Korean TaxID=1035514 RepID=A0A0J9WFD6_PLAVI|nr:hypothetical protein PVNG_04455 [Plasmodium vivax North Korean]